MSDLSQVDLELLYFSVGGVLHNARMNACYGNWYPSWRHEWPTSIKEFRTQRHAGQPWIDVAVDQVKALINSGIIEC